MLHARSRLWVGVLLGLLLCGCVARSSDPTRLVLEDGTSLMCEEGYWTRQPFPDVAAGLGICYHSQGATTEFVWHGQITLWPLSPPSQQKGWQLMSGFDSLIAKVEGLFERWIGEFEAHPLRTGFRALFAFWLLRWVYRRFIR